MNDANENLNRASLIARLLAASFDLPTSVVKEAAEDIEANLIEASKNMMWVDEANDYLSQMVSDLAQEKESLRWDLDIARDRRDWLEEEKERLQHKINQLMVGTITEEAIEEFDDIARDRLTLAEKEKMCEASAEQMQERYRNMIGLLRQGRKIDAIRVLREISGCGLVPGKEIVEEFMRQDVAP